MRFVVPRDVSIRVGKKAYFLQTSLEEAAVQRISGIVEEVASGFGEGLAQEELLLLSCLQLAWGMDRVSAKLEDLHETVMGPSL